VRARATVFQYCESILRSRHGAIESARAQLRGSQLQSDHRFRHGGATRRHQEHILRFALQVVCSVPCDVASAQDRKGSWSCQNSPSGPRERGGANAKPMIAV
jgi:hypothetical protein